MSETLTARGAVDPDAVIGSVSRRLFGSFVEHMGRAVYTGIFEPGHPAADGRGFRRDVLDLVRELGVTVVRYPGGNFVSGYRWEDGVGPVDRRRRGLDLAWHSTETNAFGLDEFIAWARVAGVEPMLAVNLGTRGIEAALDLLEYANHPGGSTLADLRVANGATRPHDVRMWCLGNEMDGPWQVGHKTAGEYGRLAAETARAMRRFDPRLELVACGSSGSGMPTFGDWERTVLEAAYDQVDLLSLHAYYEEQEGDLASFLASAVDLDRFIERVATIADEVQGRLGASRRMPLSLDEWNVWYLRDFQARDAERPPDAWPVAPPLAEDVYTVADAVVVGSLLISLLRHADRVTCACLAQLVNVIAPITTQPGGPAWRQATFHPFAITANRARGAAITVRLDGPLVGTGRFGDVPVADAVATWDEASGSLSVFAVNRSLDHPLRLDLDVSALPSTRVREALLMSHDDPYARNTLTAPGTVVPRALTGSSVADGHLVAQLPATAWAVITLVTQEPGSVKG